MFDEYTRLKIRQLDEQLERWRQTSKTPRPREGWLRTIRQVLGMTTGQFALRLGTSQPRIVKLERAEIDGSVTLASLHKAAQALGCEFVYAVIPYEPLERIIRNQADRIARRELAIVGHSMGLEKQRVKRKAETRQLKALREKLLNGPRSRLWK
ncbi:MAG: mobile mystery protein A [Bacillota bacterium]